MTIWAAWCNCNIEPWARLSPCEIHQPDEYTEWINEHGPRFATARAKGDPFIERNQWPADPAEIPEFAPLLALLSPPARAYFIKEWELWSSCEWPKPWEVALAVRDEPQAIAAAVERDTMRERLGEHTHENCSPRHPLGEYEEFHSQVASPEELLAEADELAALAADALRLERMLRDHAVGNTRPVTDYAEEQTPSCCGGTGFADYAAVPCPNPDCPVVPRLLAEMRTRRAEDQQRGTAAGAAPFEGDLR